MLGKISSKAKDSMTPIKMRYAAQKSDHKSKIKKLGEAVPVKMQDSAWPQVFDSVL